MLEPSGDGNSPFALAIFDLDRFKPINDTYGHNAGDQALIESGRRLATFASPDIIVARLGGDEFGMLIRQPNAAADVLALCNEICERLHAPILFSDIQVVTGCSGGIALYPSVGWPAP